MKCPYMPIKHKKGNSQSSNGKQQKDKSSSDENKTKCSYCRNAQRKDIMSKHVIQVTTQQTKLRNRNDSLGMDAHAANQVSP